MEIDAIVIVIMSSGIPVYPMKAMTSVAARMLGASPITA
jgi:hypothetical protein